MSVIFHITTEPEWAAAQAAGHYEAPSLKEEGFNHCCQEDQISDVLQRYFEGKKQLLKLSIDTSKLKSQLIYEWSPTNAATYPHIYGPINLDAVIATEKL
jgi:uncharacterized protein (DUF952 family)